MPKTRNSGWFAGIVLVAALVAAPIAPSFDGADGLALAKGKRTDSSPKKSSKQKKIDRHLFTAQYYYLQEQDLKAAARELNKVLRLDKGHVEAGIGLAVILVADKKTGKAIAVLEKIAKKKPDDVRVWYALAKAHRAAGDNGAALKDYEAATKIDANDREAHYQIFALVSAQQQAKKATDAQLKQAAIAFLRVESNPESYRYREVERRLVEVSGEKVALIIYDANRAYQSAFTEQYMGQINAKMGEARKGYQQCVKLQPKNERCHYGLGLVYSSVKASGHYDRKAARAEFDKAKTLPEAHFELGRLSRLEDNFDEARDSLKAALKLRDNYAHAHLELGIVYKLEGKDKNAVAHLMRAYKADSYSAVAEKALDELAKIEPNHELVKFRMRYGGLSGDVFSTDRFRAAVGLIEEAYGGVEEKAGEKRILEEVLARILEAADVDSTTPITVAVLKTPIVNAMALPNGNVYFTRGFLDFLAKTWPSRKVDANNDVLAHVMAHEVAHVLRKHTLNSVLFQQAYKDAGQSLDGAIVTHVTRLQEIEADRVGIVLASLAGYHPRGGIEFMEHQGQEAEIPTHLDHPTYEERTRYLEEYWTNDVKYAYLSFQLGNRELIEGDKALQNDPKDAKNHYTSAIEHFGRFQVTLKPTKRVLNNLGVAYAKRGMLAYAGKSSPLEKWQSQMSVEKESALKYRGVQRDDEAPGGETRGAKRETIPPDLRKSMKLFADALRRDPNYARALLNLATVQIATGKVDNAAKTLRKVKKKSGLYSLTSGIVLAEKGDYKKAANAFAYATKKAATRRQATFNLALAYQLGNEKDKSKRMYQRYLRKYPKGPWAAAAKKAMKRL